MLHATCIKLVPDPYDGGWIISAAPGRVARRRVRPSRPMNVSVRLCLPPSVYQSYAQEAARQGVTVPTVLATMLTDLTAPPSSDGRGA